MTRRYSTFGLGSTRIAVVSAPFARARLSLTPAEASVAILVARGLTDAEIATERGTSTRTVANQVRSILRKLDLGNRRALAAALVECAS